MVLQSANNNVNNNSKLTISPAGIEDIKAISTVLAKSFYDFPDFANWVYGVLRFTINEDLRYRLRSHSPRYCCLVAKLDRQANERISTEHSSTSDFTIVGTVEIALRSPSFWSTHFQHPYISNLAVNQNYRRLGIGSQLLARCEQIAIDWGYQETRLHVLDSNDSAKKLYYHNGYQILQVEANWMNLWFDYSSRLLLKKQI
ncbi:GNAT family N-acetyltransferase [Pleurocapsales cyanobacterium LEGE 10410]|nr:GNAT family N-acetyltransferase [Pleurocapsales cyanobacterium LEGE 10410]